MININIKKSCAFTGHRILGKDFDYEKLKNTITDLINKGYDTFLIGMAIGFDNKCYEILKENKDKNIKIIACIPCKNQDKYFNKQQKEEYKNNLSVADEIICLHDEYVEGCMQQRNRYMVDNASIIVTYFRYPKGGTLYTINYAKKKEKEIIYL